MRRKAMLRNEQLQRKKQIPFGNDNKGSKGKSRSLRDDNTNWDLWGGRVGIVEEQSHLKCARWKARVNLSAIDFVRIETTSVCVIGVSGDPVNVYGVSPCSEVGEVSSEIE
jgi:hypothetical protein